MSPKDFDQTDLHEIARIYFRALDQDEELDTKAFIEKNIPESVRDTFSLLKSRKANDPYDPRDLDDEILRSVAFMRQEKCEYEKSELQTLLQESDAGSSDAGMYEKMLARTLERRRWLDILIENINMIDFRNGKAE